MESKFRLRFLDNVYYLINEDKIKDFDQAYDIGSGTRMMTLADIVIDADNRTVVKSRYF